ncbi:MAG: hypothetical protein GY786_24595 [Proteobacteria bacterium]|nr:hypothetical protein [Pseudomonadota bacterium]
MNKTALRVSQAKVKHLIRKAKSDWIIKLANKLNASSSHSSISKKGWDAIKSIKKGISNIKSSKQTLLRKPDQSLCTSVEENADVFLNHFQTLYQRQPTFDASVINLLHQQPTIH